MTTSRKNNKRPLTSSTTKGKTFYGLKNQGSTCYLNSVLQVLFMNEEFREAVKRHAEENNDKTQIDRQLSELFDKLRKGTAETIGITNKLRIHSVNKQSDAAEYFEKILMLTSTEASQIFQGQLEHTTKCLHCDEKTYENGPFWHLPLTLPVTNSSSKDYSVTHGIEEFLKKSELSGENQLYCDYCHGKWDSIVECKMKHHPDILTLLLKRFEFNYNYMSYTKNKCAVDVPYILHIPQGPTYELYAFVEHFGSLKSGHYTATIKCQDDRGARWHNFNDSTVVQLNQNDFNLDNGKSYLTESHSPYLLFYSKRKHDPNIREPSTINSTCKKNNQRHDAVKRDGGETATGVDDTAVAGSVNGNEEPPVKQRVLSDHSSTEVQDNRGSAKQSRSSHQATEDREVQRSENTPPAHDVKKETVRRKNTRDRELEMTGAANVDKRTKNRKKLESEASFQNSIKDHKTVEVDVIKESGSDGVIEHHKRGEVIAKTNERKETKIVRGVKEVDEMKGKNKARKEAPRSDELNRKQDVCKVESQPKAIPVVKTGGCVVRSEDVGISSTNNSLTTRNDRENHSHEPDTDSKVEKKRNWLQKMKQRITGKDKRKKDKNEKKQMKTEKAPVKQTKKQKKKLSILSCISKPKVKT